MFCFRNLGARFLRSDILGDLRRICRFASQIWDGHVPIDTQYFGSSLLPQTRLFFSILGSPHFIARGTWTARWNPRKSIPQTTDISSNAGAHVEARMQICLLRTS
ncbi:hypothetical protein B0H12DRAFT_50792 [Mycena haematopus]|nr:hypothetical protein B0H12DRAFT_50792 [Mycena haematopus]